jgi:hypothetical protein
VNCIIMHNTGAGLHSAVSEYVDGFNDGARLTRKRGQRLLPPPPAGDLVATQPYPRRTPRSLSIPPTAGLGAVKWPTEKGKDATNLVAVVTVIGFALFTASA